MFDCELDDEFLIEAIESIEKSEIKSIGRSEIESIEKPELNNSQLLSTPPDSEILELSKGKDNVENKAIYFPKNDFRSRLLQTLSGTNKNSDSDASCFSGRSNVVIDNNVNKIETNTKVNEAKKRNCDELYDDNSALKGKKLTSLIVNNVVQPSLKSPKLGSNVPYKSLKEGPLLTSFKSPREDPLFPSFKSLKEGPILSQIPSEEDRNRKSKNIQSSYSVSNNSRLYQNKNADVSSSVIRKRKFPGPAGLLPTWADGKHLSLNISNSESSDADSCYTEDRIYSQTSAQDFVNGPWKQMLIDLELEDNNSISPMQTINIRWLLRRAGLRGQAAVRKVNFMVVMIQNIDLTHVDATAVFRDTTGEIDGTISSGVLEKFAHCISTGTSLVLKDVTVLSPGIGVAGMRSFHKKHYLNVTLNSILSIYSLGNDGHVIKTDNILMNKENLRLLINNTNECKEMRAIVEEADEKTEHALNTSLFSNLGNPETRIKNVHSPRTTHHSPYTAHPFPRTSHPSPQTSQNLSLVSGKVNGDSSVNSPLQINRNATNSAIHSTPKRDFSFNKMCPNTKPNLSKSYDNQSTNILTLPNHDKEKKFDRSQKSGFNNDCRSVHFINTNLENSKSKPSSNIFSISNQPNTSNINYISNQPNSPYVNSISNQPNSSNINFVSDQPNSFNINSISNQPISSDTNIFLDDDLDALMASIDTNNL